MEEKLLVVSKEEVINEDFENIGTFLDDMMSDEEMLREDRNQCDIGFSGYDDDPRELPEIPEVREWVRQSVYAGIPWFYFLSCDENAQGLLTLMLCCCAVTGRDEQGSYQYDMNLLTEFIRENIRSLDAFAKECGLSDEEEQAAVNTVAAYTREKMPSLPDSAFNVVKADREAQFAEALGRLETLEQLYRINPKIARYFKEGKLYYSYITGNGMIGSIDTINYDRRYAEIAEMFEQQTSCLVYHVIESGSTISLLSVGEDPSQWEDERPSAAGVAAVVVDVDSFDVQFGYIKLDVFQGALRRSSDKVYKTLERKGETDSMTDEEVVKRLEILKAAGMETDLDVEGKYLTQGEICCSELLDIGNISVCVVNPLSARSDYEKLAETVADMVEMKIYFMMVSGDRTKIAFLYLSPDPEDWEKEESDLAEGRPEALIADLEDTSLYIDRIRLKMVEGGPLCLV